MARVEGLTIRNKILLSTVALILIISFVKAYEIFVVDKLEASIHNNISKNWNSLQYSREMEAYYYLSNTAITNYIITGDKSWLNVEKDAQSQFNKAVTNLKNNAKYPADFNNAINDIETSINDYFNNINKRLNNINSLSEFLKNNNAKTDQILYKNKELIAYAQRFIVDNNRQIEESFFDTKITMAFTTIVFIVIVLIVTIVQMKFLLRPLGELLNGIKLIWAGDTSHRINIETKDEIGELAKVFNHMAGSIHREQKRLVEKATTDEMTGLYNFRYFQDVLEKEFEKASRFNHDLSFIILDVDFFKFYNDTNGHQAGDQVLKTIAKVVKNSCRDKDIPARYGGEEFVVVLPGTPLDAAVKVAERIRSAVESTPVIYQEKQPNKNLTISVGVSNYPNIAKDSKSLVESADSALYEAKENGKNKVICAK
ncbi:MAG: GGDEF domain-containing protein [Cyanobacteriota bacterium]